MDGPTFYLGTHETAWLRHSEVPLFVSHRRLSRRGALTFPKARAPWALDSGGFTELSMYGEWRTTPEEYVQAVYRYHDAIGRMAFASPQDSMCEPWVVEKTGLSVREHQERTVQNFLLLRELGPELPFVPVLQGWTMDDYVRCVDLYEQAGVDLRGASTVGLGSVCRRQGTEEIGQLVGALAGMGLRLHGFGVKSRGLVAYGHLLASADSMAWSYRARRDDPLPGCAHKSCSNCLRYALRWRERALTKLAERQGAPLGQLAFDFSS